MKTSKPQNVSRFVLYYGISSLNGKTSQVGLENLLGKDLAYPLQNAKKSSEEKKTIEKIIRKKKTKKRKKEFLLEEYTSDWTSKFEI